MLSDSLRMIISQVLVRNTEGGRTMAAEILINTPASASMIRSGKSHQLNTVIQSGAKVGMQSLDHILRELVQKEIISGEDAYENAIDRSKFERFLSREDEAAA
jgi:twitching motility protein PilT